VSGRHIRAERPEVGERDGESDALMVCSASQTRTPPMPDASDVDEGDDHRHGPSPPVGDPLPRDIGASSGMHLVSNRQAAGVIGITIFVAAIWIVTSGGAFDRSTPAVSGGSATGPAQSSTNKGVTLLLEARSDGRCCFVTSVNPGDASTPVLCFVEVFDEADRLQSTTLVPPKPPGHRRSSGFEVQLGRQEHGFQEIPLDLSDQHYVSICRPAAWHGGAPI
jgi:hypothetical protein